LVDNVINFKSLGILLLSLIVALAVGRLIAMLLQRVTVKVAEQADRTNNLNKVNRMRRAETGLVISIAVIKVILLSIALYYWWNMAYPYHNPASTIGAGVIFIVLAGNAIGPILRDIAAGSLMMAEHWFGIGDYIRVEPFIELEGVVDRMTLRSTRIRGLNGEVIWLNNQTIQGVRVTPKGTRTLAIELFVTSLEKGTKLIEDANLRLPVSDVMIAKPLTVMSSQKLADRVWQITAIGETAPGREWLLASHAPEVLEKIDDEAKAKLLLSKPVARYADSKAEYQFARTIKNARKDPIKKRRVRRSAKAKLS
jgi:hypothetical protein